MVFGSGETASEVLVALRWDSQTGKYARQVPGQDEGLGNGEGNGILSKVSSWMHLRCHLPSTRSWTFLCGHGPSSSCEGGRSSAERSQGSKLVFIFNRICCKYLDRTGRTSMCLMSSSRHVKGGYELLNPLT